MSFTTWPCVCFVSVRRGSQGWSSNHGAGNSRGDEAENALSLVKRMAGLAGQQNLVHLGNTGPLTWGLSTGCRCQPGTVNIPSLVLVGSASTCLPLSHCHCHQSLSYWCHYAPSVVTDNHMHHIDLSSSHRPVIVTFIKSVDHVQSQCSYFHTSLPHSALLFRDVFSRQKIPKHQMLIVQCLEQ